MLQKHSAKPLTTHKECGGPVERLISTSALQFKGSGFYITDYARGSGAGAKSPVKDKPKVDKADKPAPVAKTESVAAKSADTKS